MVSSSPLATGGQHVRAATRQQPAAQRPPHSARRSVEYRAVNPGPGGDAGITRRRAGGSRHKHRGWVRRGQAARIPTWNTSPRVGVSTRQGGDVAQDLSQSRASIRLATSHSNSIVHAIPGYPASSPGRPFVTAWPDAQWTKPQDTAPAYGRGRGNLPAGTEALARRGAGRSHANKKRQRKGGCGVAPWGA